MPANSLRLLSTIPMLLGGRIAARIGRMAPDRVEEVGDGRSPTIGTVHFGGPDRPSGTLRDLLEARVDATPPGGTIDWATYYFLDPALADALIAASDRGVRVTLCVEGAPRFGGASDAVLAKLRAHGLGGGLTVRERVRGPLAKLGGKLHLKIYAFSWPRPHALVGSFNPSGGEGVDAATIAEIGDQDRGHNLLVEVTSPGLVAALSGHVRALAAAGGAMHRLSPEQNRVVRDGGTALYFYPRLRTDHVEQAIERLGAGDRLHAAVSHLKSGMVATLAAAAGRGAAVRLIVHDTERRVPQVAVDRLAAAGASVRRFRDPAGLPMHAKFFVIGRDGARTAWFGSLNFNRNSRLLNDELLVRSTDIALVETLLARFAAIGREIDAQPPA